MDFPFCHGLISSIRQFEADPECDGLVFRSSLESGVFSAGIDLKKVLENSNEQTEEFLSSLIELFHAIYFCKKPTFAWVEGTAIAGGCVMAAACTYCFGTGNARFGMPGSGLDVPIPAIAPVILQSRVPVNIADALHSEQLLDSQGALASGLLDEQVTASDFESRTVELLQIKKADFRMNEVDPVRLNEFAKHDQQMIEAWCTQELRDHIAEYVRTLGSRKK